MKHGMIFSNGNVAAFDNNGAQIVDLQVKSWFTLLMNSWEEKGIDPTKIPDLKMQLDGGMVPIKAFKNDVGNWSYQTL